MKIISLDKGAFAFILGLLLWCSPMHASTVRALEATLLFQSTVTGRVTDGVGPLPGVYITVKGTGRTAVSDADGNYTIQAGAGEVLVFSFVGYAAKEVAVTAALMDVALSEDTKQIQELVINAGYYNVKQKEATGSIARITASDIETQPVTNVLAAMQGRMAGVSVTQSTGVPGGGFAIKIRGTNSLRSDGNTPLYIVDGMPYYANSFGSASNSGLILPGSGGNPLSSLNPADIESIEVLKDADATSIYGSRGANGVVLITTKKGKAGKTKVNVQSFTAFGTITRKVSLMDTGQYLDMRRQAFANDGIAEYPDYAYDVNGTWDPTRNTDWQEELIGGTSVINNLQTTLTGGNEQTNFLLSNTLYKEGTVFPGNFAYKKTAFNFSLNHASVDKRFMATASASYLADRNNLPATDLTRQALTLAPNAPELYDGQGNLNWENSTWSNPLAALYAGYEAENRTLIGNASLSYEVAKGLSLKATAGYTTNSFTEERATPSTIYNPAYGLGSENSTLSRNNVVAHSWNFEPQAAYRYDFENANLEGLAGLTFMERMSLQDGLFARGFSTNSLINNPSVASFVRALPTNDIKYRYNAVFARLNYNLMERYIVNLTYRRDGSSRFGPGKKFASFGAVGAAWIFSKEEGLTGALPVLSFGKLRASYGTTGNDQIGDYQFLNLYSAAGVSYDNIPAIQPVRLFNPDFSWETNKKFEAAIETGWFGDRVMLSAAWYRNRSSNQLVGIPLPGTTGFTSIQSNLDAVVENRGWEFDARFLPIRKDKVDWEIGMNLSLPKTELIAFPNLESSTYARQYLIGQPLDILQVYHYEGVDPQTGIYRFKDYNGDGMITDDADRKALVRRSPKFFAGMQNSLRFHNWKLDFLLQYVRQTGTRSAAQGILPGTMSNLPEGYTHAWSAPGDVSALQRLTTGFNQEAVTAFYRFAASDGAYRDASYLRLKNIALTYTLPSSLTQGVACNIYAQGQNLLTFTGYKEADPETQFSGYLPPLRILSIGINVSF